MLTSKPSPLAPAGGLTDSSVASHVAHHPTTLPKASKPLLFRAPTGFTPRKYVEGSASLMIRTGSLLLHRPPNSPAPGGLESIAGPDDDQRKHITVALSGQQPADGWKYRRSVSRAEGEPVPGIASLRTSMGGAAGARFRRPRPHGPATRVLAAWRVRDNNGFASPTPPSTQRLTSSASRVVA